MHQGNWTCSGCGGTITELPFEPKNTNGLLCRECHQKKKEGGSTDSRPQNTDKPKFSGDWKCSSCGGAISSLPFEPRDTTNLKCIDCFKKSRAG